MARRITLLFFCFSCMCASCTWTVLNHCKMQRAREDGDAAAFRRLLAFAHAIEDGRAREHKELFTSEEEVWEQLGKNSRLWPWIQVVFRGPSTPATFHYRKLSAKRF